MPNEITPWRPLRAYIYYRKIYLYRRLLFPYNGEISTCSICLYFLLWDEYLDLDKPTTTFDQTGANYAYYPSILNTS